MLRRHFLALAPQAGALSTLAFSPALFSNAYAQEGVNTKTINIGCSGALTGPLAAAGLSIKMGVEAAMMEINAKGGVRGRQLQFQLLDDAYVPQRTAENVKKMIADKGVFALMSCIGTPNNAAIMPLIDEAGMPYLAPLTGASSLRKPGSPGSNNVFHIRASYTDETQRLMQQLLNMGIKDLGIVYLDNGFGKEILADANAALQAKGARAVVQSALTTDGKNLNDVVNQVSAAKPAAVFIATAGTASTSIIAALKKSSPLMPIAGLSVALGADSFKMLGASLSGVAVAMVFPDHHRTSHQIVREYQAAMRAANQSEYSAISLEGYINTRVMAEGLDRAGPDLTRAKFKSAMASMQKFNLGGFAVDYMGTSPYVGSRFVELGVLGSGGRFVG